MTFKPDLVLSSSYNASHALSVHHLTIPVLTQLMYITVHTPPLLCTSLTSSYCICVSSSSTSIITFRLDCVCVKYTSSSSIGLGYYHNLQNSIHTFKLFIVHTLYIIIIILLLLCSVKTPITFQAVIHTRGHWADCVCLWTVCRIQAVDEDDGLCI